MQDEARSMVRRYVNFCFASVGSMQASDEKQLFTVLVHIEEYGFFVHACGGDLHVPCNSSQTVVNRATRRHLRALSRTSG